MAYTTAEADPSETLSQSSGHSSSSNVSIVTCHEADTRTTVKPLDQRSTEGPSEDKTIDQMAPSESEFPPSDVSVPQTVPKPPCSGSSTSDNTKNIGHNQIKSNQSGAVPPSSPSGLNQPDSETCPNTPEDTSRERSHSCEQEHIAGTNCPSNALQLHKAIWVETYLGEEEKEGEERGKEDCQEGLRADVAPVQALPAAIISKDNLSDTLSSVRCLQQPGEPQDPKTEVLEKNGPSSNKDPNPVTLQEKQKSGDVCVTRKTVNLPSKHKVTAQRGRSQGQHVAQEKQKDEQLPLAETINQQL